MDNNEFFLAAQNFKGNKFDFRLKRTHSFFALINSFQKMCKMIFSTTTNLHKRFLEQLKLQKVLVLSPINSTILIPLTKCRAGED